VAEADRQEITADHNDLSHIAIEFRDAEGNLATNVEQTVTVTVEGSGILQGLGSARPKTEETYQATNHTSFDGRLLAVVRPTDTGKITVTASAEGYAPARVTLEAVSADSSMLLPADTEGVSA
jgi:hypothetical protein